MNMSNNINVKQSTISAEVCRADGTRMNLGVVSYFNKNAVKTIFQKARFKVTRKAREFYGRVKS